MSDGSNTYLYGLNRIAQQNIVGRQYYLGGALGSLRQLVNPAGTIIQARSYEPFGKQFSTAENPLSKYAFTGEQQDPTGLIYLRARYYDPATGRFQSKDPVSGFIRLPQTHNPYVYSVNNPILYVDPSGQFAIPLVLASITPFGWVVIGAVALGVFVYFVVPGVRGTVTYGIYQACELQSNGLNALFASRGRYSGDPRTADEIIGAEKEGRIRGRFPSQWLGKTYDEIKKAADAGDKSAQTAKKLLDRKDYDKKKK